MIGRRVILGTALLAMTAVAIGASAQAQQYPEGRITMVVGFGAGGMTDVTSRMLAAKLEKLLGTTVIVENKAGAGGVTRRVGGAVPIHRPLPLQFAGSWGSLSLGTPCR